MKRALLVGINDYPIAPLKGSVADVKRLHPLLEAHGDGSPNYDCQILTSDTGMVSKAILAEKLEFLLLQPGVDAAIFYFSGHGSRNILGGYMMPQDARRAMDGYAFHDLHSLVMQSPIREITLLLDCCFSGGLGDHEHYQQPVVELREGVSIMAACQPDQLAAEHADGGIFTSLLVNALQGEAADIMGGITLANVYSHIDGLLTAWDQRPIFKAHISQLSPIRQVMPRFSRAELRQLRQLFPSMDHEIRLGPAYEPTADPRDAIKEAEFAMLQRFRAEGLVAPTPPHIHMYHAAIGNGRCQLTVTGRFYWRMLGK